MRTIKFRGKRVSDNEWVYGYFVGGNERKTIHPSIFVYLPDKQSYDLFDIIEPTLGQFTGLHDNNGREIYERDIVYDSYTESNYVIEFRLGEFIGVKEEVSLGRVINSLSQYGEVIGNIHDNKELLK